MYKWIICALVHSGTSIWSNMILSLTKLQSAQFCTFFFLLIQLAHFSKICKCDSYNERMDYVLKIAWWATNIHSCCHSQARPYRSNQCYQTRGLGAQLGYFWLPCCGQQSLTATFRLLLTSWPRNVLKSGTFVKNCQFLVNSGGFWTFSTSMSRFIVNW